MNIPMKLAFLHYDHSTTLWSRLKSTHYQIFRLFPRLLLKFKLFQVYFSHWICRSQRLCAGMTDYFQWIRKFKCQVFTTNLIFENRPLYNAAELWHTSAFRDISSFSEIIVEIQAFSGLYQSLNVSISS